MWNSVHLHYLGMQSCRDSSQKVGDSGISHRYVHCPVSRDLSVLSVAVPAFSIGFELKTGGYVHKSDVLIKTINGYTEPVPLLCNYLLQKNTKYNIFTCIGVFIRHI